MLSPNGLLQNVRFGNVDDGERIAQAAGTTFNWGVDPVIARVTPKGELMGGVLFSYWTGFDGSINMHSAGFHPRWVNRTMLWVCFDYPFNQLGVKKIFGQVPEDNERALRFNLNLGFEVEQMIKDVYPSGDMILMSMYREHCRFLDRGLLNGR